MSLKVQEVVKANCSSGTNPRPPQGAEMWNGRGVAAQPWADLCDVSHWIPSLCLRGQAREGLPALSCVPRILGRAISKGFLTQMNSTPRQWESLQVGFLASWESSVKLWRSEHCQRAGERLVSSLPTGEDRRWDLGTKDHSTSCWSWQRTVDYRVQVMRWHIFKRKWWP